MTGSGIRTTKAKETVNNLKTPDALSVLELDQDRKGERRPWLIDFGIFLSQRVAVRLSYGVL